MSISPDEFAGLLLETDALFEELIVFQRNKVAQLASRLHPNLTGDDLLNPHDYPELAASGHFQYEDGMFNAYISAQMAWRARILSKARDMLHAAGYAPGGSEDTTREGEQGPLDGDQ